MTVSTSVNKIVYPGTGAQTVFTFSFAFPFGTATQEAANFQVFFTDTNGNITLLTQGPGTTQYQITFNPPTGTNPTPAGGQVTYNPSGTPIALGTFLTILRNMPLTQGTSLANQGTQYQPVIEGALDYDVMLSQQVLEIQQRAFQVPVSDPVPGPVPAVAQRKNLVFGFDSSGNPIAVSSAPAGTISSAMAPVVGAATLAAGRTAFGLGTVAVENIGTGLADDGSGNLTPRPPTFSDSGAISITGTSHTGIRYVTATATYTLPAVSTVFSGFYFTVITGLGSASFTPNVADSFFGLSGPLTVPPGATVKILVFSSNLWVVEYQTDLPSFNAVTNLQLNASVAGSALTIALKDRNANDPSATSAIIYDVSAGGIIVQRIVTSALSITVPNGATLGTVNGVGNRIWVGLFDNAGSPVIGVYNSVTGNNIASWDESGTANGTAISAGSTSAQVWYTSSGITGRAFRILGYVESTQPTAGAWTASPSKIQLFGPGIRKPGDVVQEINGTTTTAGTTSSATFSALATGQTVTITPLSASSLIRLDCSGSLSGANAAIQFSRGNTAATNLIGNVSTVGVVWAYDLPNTIISQLYAIQGKTTGVLTFGGAGLQTIVSAKEIFV